MNEYLTAEQNAAQNAAQNEYLTAEQNAAIENEMLMTADQILDKEELELDEAALLEGIENEAFEKELAEIDALPDDPDDPDDLNDMGGSLDGIEETVEGA
jgi:hypothetical protein